MGGSLFVHWKRILLARWKLSRASSAESASIVVLGLAVSLGGGCIRSPTIPSVPEASPSPIETGCATPTSYHTGDPALDGLQARFLPVLEANRRSFAGRTGRVDGFGAGAAYPQIWLRDSATLLPATRYLYPSVFLGSWLEEHLSHQMPNGALWDWIASGEPAAFVASAPRATRVYSSGGVILSADKNTTAADQESSAVDAAWKVFRLTGDRTWLAKPIDGRTLLDRLDAALAYVESERLDETLGLVVSALTADWGDVSPAHADQRAIYQDEETPLAAGLYANVFFSRAADELADMHEALGNLQRAQHWRQVAESIRDRLDLHLWDSSGGFYRMHRAVLSGGREPFDDSHIFALGGNALAALYGVASASKAGEIFATADARRRDLGIPSVAGVLMPPYPTGFFLHPILREAYTYQNGGLWDWWSGRFIQGLFQRGYSRTAREQLDAVARRAAESGGLFEWYTREGAGRGSDRYAGNVGALAGAIYEGLFGLESSAAGLNVTLRLGSAAGGVRVCEPASGRTLAFEYEYQADHRLAILRYESNAPGRGQLAVRLPERGATVTEVLLDGQPASFTDMTVGEDDHIQVTTDWAPHRLQVRIR